MRSCSRSSMRSHCCSMLRSRSGKSVLTPPGRFVRKQKKKHVPAVALLTPASTAGVVLCCEDASGTGVFDCGALRRVSNAAERSRAAVSSRPQFAASKTSLRRSCFSWASECCLVATREPQFFAALQPLVGGERGFATRVAYVLLFGVASPLVLYRGPLNPFGVGIAIFTALLTAHVLPPVVLVAAIMAVVQVQNVCDPTNTANVWVANFTGVPIVTITKRTLALSNRRRDWRDVCRRRSPRPALFGERPFSRSYKPRVRTKTLPGFYAAHLSARSHCG